MTKKMPKAIVCNFNVVDEIVRMFTFVGHVKKTSSMEDVLEKIRPKVLLAYQKASAAYEKTKEHPNDICRAPARHWRMWTTCLHC